MIFFVLESLQQKSLNKIMSNKKKILVIQKVHDKGMELINNHPDFDVEVTDDVSIENLKTKIKD